MTISLAAVVAQVESGNNPYAIRFEPAVYARLLKTDDQEQNATAAKIRQFERLHGCSPNTARMLMATSWGAYQMMGENLSCNVLRFIGDPAAQLAEFLAFGPVSGLAPARKPDASWLATDEALALAFAARYNGPGDPAGYLQRLRAALAQLQG